MPMPCKCRKTLLIRAGGELGAVKASASCVKARKVMPNAENSSY